MDRSKNEMDKSQIRQKRSNQSAAIRHPLAELTIQITSANDVEVPVQWRRLTPRREWYTRLYLSKGGCGRVKSGDQMIELMPRRFYLLPSSRRHEFFDSPEFGHHWVHFTATLVGGLSVFEWVDCPHEHTPGDYVSAVEAMSRISDLCLSDDWREQLEAEAILRQLIQPFLNGGALSESLHLTFIQRLQPVFQFIEQHLTQSIRIADLAARVNLHPTYFSNLFCKHLGRPPQEYIISRRIAKAQLMLSATDAPVKQIAAEVGFDDPYHFSNLFRRKVGLSPTTYREQTPDG